MPELSTAVGTFCLLISHIVSELAKRGGDIQAYKILKIEVALQFANWTKETICLTIQ